MTWPFLADELAPPSAGQRAARMRYAMEAPGMTCGPCDGPDSFRRRAIGSAGERLVHTEEVTGSIPVSPTYPAQRPVPIIGPAVFDLPGAARMATVLIPRATDRSGVCRKRSRNAMAGHRAPQQLAGRLPRRPASARFPACLYLGEFSGEQPLGGLRVEPERGQRLGAPAVGEQDAQQHVLCADVVVAEPQSRLQGAPQRCPAVRAEA